MEFRYYRSKMYNNKSNSLLYQVKVFDEDGKLMIERSLQKELIDVFVN